MNDETDDNVIDIGTGGGATNEPIPQDVPFLPVPMMMAPTEQRWMVERGKQSDGMPCVVLWVNQRLSTFALILSVEMAGNLERQLSEARLGISVATAVPGTVADLLRMPGKEQ